MARRIKGQFGPINSDLDVHDLPSGTCRTCLNTDLDGNTLKGRIGFDYYNIVPNSRTILNSFTCTFANGNTYFVVKATTGSLYYLQIGGSWGTINDKWSGHNTGDRGWFFFHGDRLYYFDSDGGTKWHPVDGTWKAGIGMPTVKAFLSIPGAPSGGSKDGFYFATSAGRNSVTGEIGMAADLYNSKGAINGGINIGSGAATGSTPPMPSTVNYEWDELWMFCSSGQANDYNYNWRDLALEKVGTTAPGNDVPLLGDNGHRQLDEPCHNAGGEPPGATIGAYNGNRAVYGGVSDSEIIWYSLPGQPTMVPKEYIYDTVNSKIKVRPRPWEGKLAFGINGKPTAISAVGERFVVYTETQTFWLVPMGDGRLRAVLADSAHGASALGAVVQTPNGTYALGVNSLTLASQRGVTNLARYRFRTILEDIPSAYIHLAVGGYSAHRGEVWFAVPKSGATVANRVLIFDEERGTLTGIWEPANLESLGIVAINELTTTKAEPIMLLTRSDGVILSWPNSTYTDDTGDAVTVDYATNWTGYFAVENRANDLFLNRITAHMRANAGGLTATIAGYRTATEADVTEGTFEIPTTSANTAEHLQTEFDPNLDGNLFYVKFDSTTDQDPNWGIAELILDLERTDR